MKGRYTPPTRKVERDCPLCRFGTLVDKDNDKELYVCIDCGRTVHKSSFPAMQAMIETGVTFQVEGCVRR